MLEWSPNTPLGVLTPATWGLTVDVTAIGLNLSFFYGNRKVNVYHSFLYSNYFFDACDGMWYITVRITLLFTLQVSNPTVDHKSRIQCGGFTWPSAVFGFFSRIENHQSHFQTEPFPLRTVSETSTCLWQWKLHVSPFSRISEIVVADQCWSLVIGTNCSD